MSENISLNNAINTICETSVTIDQLKNDNESYIPLFKNGSEAKKILGKLLANNGGSSDYAMPTRVIVIDTALSNNIEGKAYKTFADAYEYMTSINTSERFCVELPSGDFNEDVIIDEKWMIHGNNTTIKGIVKSDIVVDYTSDGIMKCSLPLIFIKDCIIDGGFEGITMGEVSPTSINLIPSIDNCIVKRFSQDSITSQTGYAFIKFRNCRIDTRETTFNSNEILSTVFFIDCEIMQIESTLCDGVLFLNCIVNCVRNHSDQNNIRFSGCEFIYLEGVEGHSEISASSVDIINCSAHSILMNISNEVRIFNSDFRYTNIPDGGTLCANPSTIIEDLNGNNFTDNRCNVIMFSNNSSGSNMQGTPNPEWQTTYMGICMDFLACDKTQDYSKYMWILFNK